MHETPTQIAARMTTRLGALVNAYEYRDTHGRVLFWNLRIRQADGRKTFRMMTAGSEGYQLSRPDSLRPEQGWPLYGLHSLEREGHVWIVEGEKDVDSLQALGLAAVTSGSTSTAQSADWTPLAGREVVLWPDNDAAGQKYMDEVAAELKGLGCKVERIDTATLEIAEKGDASDWLEAHPNAGKSEVLRLTRTMVDAQPAIPAEADLRRVEIVRADSILPQAIDWIWNGWLAVGKLHLLGGQPGTGKTTIALALAATITNGGVWPDGTTAERGSVLVWSGEDDPADTLVPRLRAAGADMSRVHFVMGVQMAGESADQGANDQARTRGMVLETST